MTVEFIVGLIVFVVFVGMYVRLGHIEGSLRRLVELGEKRASDGRV